MKRANLGSPQSSPCPQPSGTPSSSGPSSGYASSWREPSELLIRSFQDRSYLKFLWHLDSKMSEISVYRISEGCSLRSAETEDLRIVPDERGPCTDSQRPTSPQQRQITYHARGRRFLSRSSTFRYAWRQQSKMCAMEVQSGRFTQSSTKNFLDARSTPNTRKQTRSSLALLLDQDVVHNVDQATTYRPDSSIVAAYAFFLVCYTPCLHASRCLQDPQRKNAQESGVIGAAAAR